MARSDNPSASLAPASAEPGPLLNALHERRWLDALDLEPAATPVEREQGLRILRAATLWQRANDAPGSTRAAAPMEDDEVLKAMARLATLFFQGLSPHALAAGGHDAASFLTQPEQRGKFRPSHNAVKVACLTAEAGALQPLQSRSLSRVDWQHTPVEWIERLAVAFSRQKGFSESDFALDGPGVWTAWATQFIDQGKNSAFLALIREAKALGQEPWMAHAEPALAMALVRRAGILANRLGWQEALTQPRDAGFPFGSGLLAAIMAEWAWRSSAEMPALAQRAKSTLDWAVLSFGLGEASVSHALERVCATRLGALGAHHDASAEKLDQFTGEMVLWCLEKGAVLTPEAWRNLAIGGNPSLVVALGATAPARPPTEALIGAAQTPQTRNGVREGVAAHANLASLLTGFSWSDEERGQAFRAAAEFVGLPDSPREALSLLEDAGPLPSSDYSAALLAFRQGPWLGHHVCAEINGWAAHFIAKGGNPRGPLDDGEPLRAALKSENFILAQTLADAGGWGIRAINWLLLPRKGDSSELREWAQRARALKDESALKKVLASVSRKQAKSEKHKSKTGPSAAPATTIFSETTSETTNTLSPRLPRRRL